MRFIDDKSKDLKWWNRNYFFVGTVLYITINFIFFTVFGGIQDSLSSSEITWDNFWPTFLFYLKEAYIHTSWNHLFHNMLGFFFVGIYIERRKGSFSLILLLLYISTLCSFMETGQSVIWFFMIGYTVIDYLFSLKKSERNITNIIFGAIIIALEYFRCCFYDKTGGGIGITYYPYQLIKNYYHYSAFIIGVSTALFFELSHLISLSKYRLNGNENLNNDKISKTSKFVYIIASLLIFISCGISVYTSLAVQERDTYTVEIVCSDSSYNQTTEIPVNVSLIGGIQDFLNEWRISSFGENFDGVTFDWEYSCYNNEFIPLSYSNKIVIYAKLNE